MPLIVVNFLFSALKIFDFYDIVAIAKMRSVGSRLSLYDIETKSYTLEDLFNLFRLRSLTFGVYFDSNNIFVKFISFVWLVSFIYRVVCRIAWDSCVAALPYVVKTYVETTHTSYTSKFDDLSDVLPLQPRHIQFIRLSDLCGLWSECEKKKESHSLWKWHKHHFKNSMRNGVFK